VLVGSEVLIVLQLLCFSVLPNPVTLTGRCSLAVVDLGRLKYFKQRNARVANSGEVRLR
jgi:hypothetical protein